MTAEMSCHLVDLIALQTTGVSLTLGYLQAFAEADPRIAGRCSFSQNCRHIKHGIEPSWQVIKDKLNYKKADKCVFGFTNYFWNRQQNLELAQRVKSISPESLIIFGGNDVTDQGQKLLTENSPVDIVVNGEGEAVFSNLLAAILDKGKDFRQVRGISFRDEEGNIVTTEAEPRIEKLDIIPSPFTTGVFDTSHIETSRQIVFEFSRGCPFKCAFCYWGGAVGTRTRRFSTDRIRNDLEFIISRAQNGTVLWLADSNFGMTQGDVDAASLLVELVRKYNKKFYMLTSWAKNTSRRVIEAASILYEGGLINGVTLSAQSMDMEVLRIARRQNIPFEYYQQLQREFRQRSIPTYTELIFGMPGETYQSFLKGVDKVISAGGTPFIYPLLLLNNTEFNDPQIIEEHGIQSRIMPYSGFDTSSQAETVIGHNKLPYQDWLRGMAVRLAVPLFHSGFLKFVMTRIHTVYDISYAEMFDRLVDYCMRGRVESSEFFRSVFLNYVESWDLPARYDAALVEPILQGVSEPYFVHHQSLMKSILDDPAGAKELIVELTMVMMQEAAGSNSEEIESWAEYQKLLVEAMAQAACGETATVKTNLKQERLNDFTGKGIAIEENGMCVLKVRREYSCLNFDFFMYRISYGSIDSSKMFEQFAPDYAQAAQA